MRARNLTLLLAVMVFLVPVLPACSGPVPAEEAEGDLSTALVGVKVKLALLDKLGTDGLRIDVDAEGGRIVLSGEVKARASQELAKEIALGVEGVAAVDNRLVVRQADDDAETPVSGAVAKAEREVQDAALEARVKANLIGEIGRHALRVEVEATDGRVTLRGRVPDAARKRLALKTAKNTPGVEDVIDLLKTS